MKSLQALAVIGCVTILGGCNTEEKRANKAVEIATNAKNIYLEKYEKPTSFDNKRFEAESKNLNDRILRIRLENKGDKLISECNLFVQQLQMQIRQPADLCQNENGLFKLWVSQEMFAKQTGKPFNVEEAKAEIAAGRDLDNKMKKMVADGVNFESVREELRAEQEKIKGLVK